MKTSTDISWRLEATKLEATVRKYDETSGGLGLASQKRKTGPYLCAIIRSRVRQSNKEFLCRFITSLILVIFYQTRNEPSLPLSHQVS